MNDKGIADQRPTGQPVVMIALVVAGALLGAGLMFAVSSDRDDGKAGVADTSPVRNLSVPPAIGLDSARQLRDAGYAGIDTVADILELPTHFMRLEAAYALAGRSDFEQLTDLVNDIDDTVKDVALRERLLPVFFSAMASIDGLAALDAAKAPAFRSRSDLRRTIWQTWARDDLDSALAAANTQFGADRAEAAAGLFRAYGILGNPTVERIAQVLGTGPSRSLRREYLEGLINDGFTPAVRYVDSIEAPLERRDALTWLAAYPPVADLNRLRVLIDELSTLGDRMYLEEAIDLRLAETDPWALLEKAVASGEADPSYAEVRRALTILIAEDREGALQFLERASVSGNMMMFDSIFAEVFATIDPQEALVWAKTSAGGVEQRDRRLRNVLTALARVDPEMAFLEAMQAPTRLSRLVTGQILGQIAKDDVNLAMSMLERIDSSELRDFSLQRIANERLRANPEATLQWILTLDADIAAGLLSSARVLLLRSDVYAAIRALDSLPASVQPSWRRHIARELVGRGRAQEAEAFIQQFEGEAGYADLRADFAVSIAADDPSMARAIAQGTGDSEATDRVLGELLKYVPGESFGNLNQRLAEIGDEQHRAEAARRYLRGWAADEPDAAARWVEQQPAGLVRDDAIVGLISAQDRVTADHEELIESISDPGRRSTATAMLIARYARTDPLRAREMLDSETLSSSDAMRLRFYLNRLH